MCRGRLDYGEPICQSLSGQRLDALVIAQVLSVLQPAALELHLSAGADVAQERRRLHQHWQQQLERAHYEADYLAVPEPNLLVCATHAGYLEQVLRRMAGKSRKPGKRAFPEYLAGWRHVDKTAPFWAIRHYAQKSAAEVQATGLIFAFDPARGGGGQQACEGDLLIDRG